MGSIRVDGDTKERFKELQPDDDTQGEFVRRLLETYEQSGPGVDPEQWADRVSEQIADSVANKVEIGAYRGAQHALEENDYLP